MDMMKELARPFEPSEVSFKPGAVSKDGKSALAMAYADPRVYMERLDALFGGEWEVRYVGWGDRIICELSLPVGPDWSRITRSSTGEPDKQSVAGEIAGTATEAQAFKRACVMFGLGRYLYSFPLVWVAYDRSSGFDTAGLNQLRLRLRRHYDEWRDKAAAAPPDVEPPPEEVNYYPVPVENPEPPADDRNQVQALRSWATKLDVESQKPLSGKQYGLLVELIDKRYGTKCHDQVLSDLVSRPVNHKAPPGWKIEEIIDWLMGPEEHARKLAVLDDLAVGAIMKGDQ